MLDVDVEKERISLGMKQLERGGVAVGGGARRRRQQGRDGHRRGARGSSDGGLEVQVGDDGATGFIKRTDLGRDRDEQRPERFQVGQKFDAQVIGFDRSKKPNFSIKALQIAEEKQAVAQYGSSDSGAIARRHPRRGAARKRRPSQGEAPRQAKRGKKLKLKSDERRRFSSRCDTKWKGAGAAMHLRPFPFANRLIGNAPAPGGGVTTIRIDRGDSMIRSELVQKLCSDFPDLAQREVENVVGALFDSITDQLAKGGRVELRGFGAFSTRQRDARTGRNPRTGEAVEVDAKRVPYFKPGKEMRERLNLNGEGSTAEYELDRSCLPRPGGNAAWPCGRGGMVDAGDLKSSARRACGFKSRRPHQH